MGFRSGTSQAARLCAAGQRACTTTRPARSSTEFAFYWHKLAEDQCDLAMTDRAGSRLGISGASARGRAKASSLGLVAFLARAAYLSNHSGRLFRNHTAKLKLEAMGKRSDPLVHDTWNVLLNN